VECGGAEADRKVCGALGADPIFLAENLLATPLFQTFVGALFAIQMHEANSFIYKLAPLD
jgi:hypothetical protein